MAKATGPQLPIQALQKTFHKRVYLRLHKGMTVVQAWPVARGKPKSPVTKGQNVAFKRFVAAVYDMQDDDKVGARYLAAGSTDTWRDVLSRAITGRLIEIDGMAEMALPFILDAISDVVGAMLVRTEAGWVGLLPGDDDQVIMLVDGVPSWQNLVIPPSGITTLHGDAVAGPGSGDQLITLANSGVAAGTYAGATVTLDAKGRVTAASAHTYLTQNDTITLSGDITGSGRTAITGTLANSGVVAGTYQGITLDAKGRATAAADQGYITQNQTITLSGDITGTGRTAITGTLANSGVVAGTYAGATVDVDAKGRVTAASAHTYLTQNDTITLSGDITGSGRTAITGTLANSGVVAGTYYAANVTVDAKGRVTSIASSGAAGAGLYANVLTAPPTQSGTGLTTTINAGYVTAVITDGASGITLNAASNGSRMGLYGKSKAAPSTGTKTVTALISLVSILTNSDCWAGIGYSDGTKYQIAMLLFQAGTVGPVIDVVTFSDTTHQAGTPFTSGSNQKVPPLVWLQLQDDGTNVIFRWSMDGAAYQEFYRVAKASGYLGASGYTNIAYVINPYSATGQATLLSYLET